MTTTSARIRALYERGDLTGDVGTHGNGSHSTNYVSQSDFDDLESRVSDLENA